MKNLLKTERPILIPLSLIYFVIRNKLSFYLKDLRNRILGTVRVWSLFCSIWVEKSLHCLSFRKTSPSSLCAFCLFCSSIYRRQVLCEWFLILWKTSWLLLILLIKKHACRKRLSFKSLIYKAWNIHTKSKSVKNIFKNKIC